VEAGADRYQVEIAAIRSRRLSLWAVEAHNSTLGKAAKGRENSMTIRWLDHVNISTADVEATCDFYVGLLGLVEGERPPFSFPGRWLYCGDRAVVHIVGLTKARPQAVTALDHFCFDCDDFDDVTQRLERAKYAYEVRIVPGSGRRQVFLCDPNGINVELNFGAPVAGRVSASKAPAREWTPAE
jgi:catechol 2,3-dioxygenase-like lactoylglutathione lyase family enzyme